MHNKLVVAIQEKWTGFICALALALLVFNTVLFFPGYMSPDSINQLMQAKGLITLNDWHPPVMALVWRALIAVTGHPSTMLLIQLGMEWLILAILSLYLYRRTGLKRLSLLPLFVGLLPMLLNMSGVIWKDVQMANALGLATSLGIVLPYIKTRYRTFVLFVALSALLYAALLRYNVIIATVPVLVMVLRSYWGGYKSKRTIGVHIAAFYVLVGLCTLIISGAFNVRSTNPASAVMLDDIINTRYAGELYSAPLPDGLRDALVNAQSMCKKSGVEINGYTACINEAEKEELSIKHYRELQGYWIRSLIRHPIRYVSYRTYTFSLLIFMPEVRSYVWQDGIIDNPVGQRVRFGDMGRAARVYVVDFGYRHFSFLFETWFWLVLVVVASRYGRRFVAVSCYINAVLLSVLLYVFSYAPSVVATEYRYIYWLVIGMVIVCVLILAERRKTVSTHSSEVHSC